MSDLTLLEIQKAMEEANTKEYPYLRVSVLRNITVEPMESFAQYLAHSLGFRIQIQYGNYDNIIQEALSGGEGLLDQDLDFVQVFFNLEVFSRRLIREFSGMSGVEIEGESDRVKEYVSGTLEGIRRHTDAIILWNGLECPDYPAFGIADYRQENSQLDIVTELNRSIRQILGGHDGAYFVDLNMCKARVGIKSFYDERYQHIAKNPYTREGMEEIAKENFKYVRSLKGKSKKCLILDCDNTLWGGIVGEDGLGGIRLDSEEYPGSAYYKFQQVILNLFDCGILLALCSKNNEQDVWEVFKEHRDMVLREEHIVASQINWNDKASNIVKIAEELDLPLDSMVYVDDSPFEVQLIREILPDVHVLHLPDSEPSSYANILSALGLFDTISLSREDMTRSKMYQQESNRKKEKKEFSDLESFLKSLKMTLEIRNAREFEIPRIAQLTQKTNQFNLTSRRYSEANIKSMLGSQKFQVLHARLIDKFGDSGIIGVCIMLCDEDVATIDTYLLSCRVLGRQVEETFLTKCIGHVKDFDIKKIVGEYIPTRKNVQVENFYSNFGFKINDDRGECRRYELKLPGNISNSDDYFMSIDMSIEADGME